MSSKKKVFNEFVWLFVIGCILGYIIEVSCYYYKHEIWLNKQGLLYGPFKPIYGLAILVITFIYNKTKIKNAFSIFATGVIIGTIYEYSLSLFQEYVLHTSTWNYSSFKYNINGRIYLPYCIAWGVVTLIWIKFLYPKLKKLIHKIPFKLTVVVGILMILDVVISGLAVYEYSNRKNNVETNNPILKLMDKYYPNEVINKRMPKLRAIKNAKK